MLTGPLLYACHFPLGQGWLGWVALVPLLSLVRAPLSRRAWSSLAYASGLLFFVPVLSWMRLADPMMAWAWLSMAAYLSLYFPLAIALLRRIDQRTGLPLMVAVPLVWVPLEYARSRLFGGFAWYTLGVAQHSFLHLIQLADLAGVSAISAFVAMANGYLADALPIWPLARHALRPAIAKGIGPRSQALVMLTAFVLALSYGAIQLAHAPFTPGPRVALLQGNVAQSVRNATIVGGPDAGAQAGAIIFKHYMELAASAGRSEPKPDLIVWPETSFVQSWYALAPGVEVQNLPLAIQSYIREQRTYVAQYAKEVWHAPTLLGVNGELVTAEGVVSYNMAQLIRADGTIGDQYSKMHRVPFGEYVPYVDALPFLKNLTPYQGNSYTVQAGDRATRFALGAWNFAALICYEDGDDTLARQYVAPGADKPVDFLVNLSNDGWFHGSSEHEEHLAVSRFRAVEARRPLVRAVNMGISAVIDSDGNVIALPGPTWSASKGTAAALTASVPLDTRGSLFARWGDWLPIALSVGLLLALFVREGSR